MTPKIELVDVRKGFGGKPVLAGVSLKVVRSITSPNSRSMVCLFRYSTTPVCWSAA